MEIRKEIELEKYGWEIKKYIIKILKDNHMINDDHMLNDIEHKLENLKVYVENLVEKNIGRMVSRSRRNPPEIAIDQQFFDFYTMSLKEKNQKVIFSQIIHEMLHQISSFIDKDGNLSSGIKLVANHSELYRVMDEGFTQMITERITGFTLSPNTDIRYTYFKNIAKIIADTVGDDVVYESYFKHNHSVDNVLSEITQESNYFRKLMAQMTILNCVTLDNCIINNVKEQLIKKICCTIIVPKLKLLTKNEQRIYLRNLEKDLKNDDEFFSQIKYCTNKFYKLSDEQLKSKKEEIEKNLAEYKIMGKINTINYNTIDVGKSQEYVLSEILPIVSFYEDNGAIKYNNEISLKCKEKYYIFSSTQIKSLVENRESYKDEIYSKLYIRNFAVKRKNKTFDEVNEMINKNAMKNAKNGIAGKILFLKDEEFFERYSKFITIKKALEQNGIIILDNVENAIVNDEIQPNFVKLPAKNEIYNFDELKKVNELINIIEYKDDDLGKRKRVINSITGKEINNGSLIEVAKFADTWCKSFPNKEMAFCDNSKKVYKKFITEVSDYAMKTEEMNYTEIYNNLREFLRNNNLENNNESLKILLNSSENLNNIIRFTKQIYPDIISEVERANTLDEVDRPLESKNFTREKIYKSIYVEKKISDFELNENIINVDNISNIINEKNEKEK